MKQKRIVTNKRNKRNLKSSVLYIFSRSRVFSVSTESQINNEYLLSIIRVKGEKVSSFGFFYLGGKSSIWWLMESWFENL